MSRKRILSVLLSVLMLFTFVTPSLAADLKDVEGTEYVEAVERLVALGIMQGYEDGTFRVEKNITRAEFSTLVARALGLEATAKASAGSTKFKDVKEGHWASGYINLAVSKGIIKGYPDGTFKPEANVSYAEAVTMVVRTLGYGPSIETTDWPTNYLAKAAEIGLLGNLEFDQKNSANRGNVAILLNNSLEIDLMKQVGYGDEKTWREIPGSTLLTDYLYVHQLEEAIIAETVGVSKGNLNDDEVKVTFEENTYRFKLAADVEVESLLGHEVTVFVKDADRDKRLEEDETVMLVTNTTDSRDIIAWDYIADMSTVGTDWTVAGNKVEITLDATDDTFALAKNAVVYYNHEKVTNLSNLASGELGVGYAYLWEVAGKIIINDDDEIIFMNVMNYDNPVVITEVNVNDEKIKYFNVNENETTLRLDGETYTIYKNGKLSTLNQLAKDDVMYQWKASDNSYTLEAYSGKISGTLEAIYADANKYWDYSLVVDGKTIYVGPNFTLSVDDNDTINLLGTVSSPVDTARLTELEDMMGHPVTVYLGKYQAATDGWNYGRHIVSNVDSTTEEVFVVSESPWKSRTAGTKYYIELINKYDVEVVYELTEDDTEVNGVVDKNLAVLSESDLAGLFAVGTMVDVEFNSDGTVAAITALNSGNSLADDTMSGANVDDSYDRIRMNGVWYYVTDNTTYYVVYKDAVTGNVTDIEATSWNAISDISDVEAFKAIAKVDGKEIEALTINTSADLTVGQNDYGFVLTRIVKTDGLYVRLAVENEVAEYYAGDLSSGVRAQLLEGTLVKFKATGTSLDSIEQFVSRSTLSALNPGTISKGAVDRATVTEATYNTVTKVTTETGYDFTVDVAGTATKVGTFTTATNTFVAEAGYDVTFAWNRYEIVSGGVDVSNGVLEVIPFGGDEDIDGAFFIDVDKYNEDSYYYDIDVSHLADASKKVLSLSTLNDGDIIAIYDVEDTTVVEYVIVLDR